MKFRKILKNSYAGAREATLRPPTLDDRAAQMDEISVEKLNPFFSNVIFFFNEFFFFTSFLVWLKIFFIFFLILFFFISSSYLKSEKIFEGEYQILIMFSIFGLLLLFNVNNFLSFFLCIEIYALSCYI